MKNIFFTIGFFMLNALSWGQENTELTEGLYAVFNTSKGEIICELYYEKAPMTVGNFVGLAEGGFSVDTINVAKPFYDGLKFHRVIAEFMIQGGDPQGTGMGGPGYKFYDEIDPTLKHLYPGILSMANAGPNTNGSQFFITHKATPWLDGKHTVFGKVVLGLDIVNSIQQEDIIKSIKIARIGKSAMSFDAQSAFNNKYFAMKRADDLKKIAYGKIAATPIPVYNEEFKNRVMLKEANKSLVQTSSGLMYFIELPGESYKPEMGSKISLHYRGTFLESGEKFDASYDRNACMDFNYQVQKMVPGFEEGIKLIGKGGKAKLFIPYHLAYGAQGRPGIAPYADLVFEIEMVNCALPSTPMSPDGHEHHEGDGHKH